MDEEAVMIEANERGNERYAAFGLRVKQLFTVKAKLLSTKAAAISVKAKSAALANARYTAYSSDVGEAFRPVVPEWAVRGTYGLAIAYICGDVGLTTYNESLKPEGNPTRAFVHASVFQGIASLALPMFIIHQAVHAAQYATKRIGRFTKWGPTLAGLALIPALPYAVDEPCEHAIDYVFDQAWPVPLKRKATQQAQTAVSASDADAAKKKQN
jgi:fission process protein 1